MSRRIRFTVSVVAVVFLFAIFVHVYQADYRGAKLVGSSGWPSEWLSSGTGGKEQPADENSDHNPGVAVGPIEKKPLETTYSNDDGDGDDWRDDSSSPFEEQQSQGKTEHQSGGHGAQPKPTPSRVEEGATTSGSSSSSKDKAESPLSSHDSVDIVDSAEVDWSRFAYVQYVTNYDYLCNAVMIFESLHRLKSRADRVMLYPTEFLVDPTQKTSDDRPARLLIKARDEYKAKLVPIEVQRRETESESWAESYTKLLAFNQTQYDRVLSLDSDSTLLQTMDELFLLPPCPVAMPRAYWMHHDDPPKRILSSQVMLLQPDAVEFQRITEKINKAGISDYDMDIVNDLYYDSALVLPHRPYDMLTGEFRQSDHSPYLGSPRETWDPVAVYNEAKFVHYSDWPVPKPWVLTPEMGLYRGQMQPECPKKDGKEDCTARDIWNRLYDDFRDRRGKICSFDD